MWESENVKKDIHSVNLTESEASLRRHGELEAELAVEPDMQVFGNCLVISIGENSLICKGFHIIEFKKLQITF